MTADDLTAALRACAAGLYPLEAGVALLISNGTFLRRSDFTTRFISHGTSNGTPMAAIDWDAAITALTSGCLPCSGGERRLLMLSASMSAAVALMLEGMPSPWDLHLHQAAGRVVVLVGSTVVAEYGGSDLAMRNMVIVTLRRVGFGGWRVAEVFGLTPTYVARLKSAAARDGAAALAGQDGPGRPRALGEDKWDLARQWREQGESDLEIGRRLGVAGTTVARRLAAGPAAGADAVPGQEELEFAEPGRDPELAEKSRPGPGPQADSGPEQEEEEEPGDGARLAAEPGPGPGEAAGAARDGPAAVRCGRSRAGRRSPAGCSGRGMRGRCCCTRSRPGPGRGRCWRPPPGPAGPGGSAMWRCCRRPACASRWGLRRSSRSST